MPATPASPPSDDLPTGTVDVVVIGGGAAGLNAALMLGRSRRIVVVVDAGSPRNAPADGVHGLLGHDGIPPAELVAKGRAEVRSYGGSITAGTVIMAAPAAPSADGDLRFTITLDDARTITARRVLVATGLRDVLPDIPGLQRHWGGDVVHCPYCHGWEVRDQAIGVLASGPMSVHQALLFRQLTDDLVFFSDGTDLDPDVRDRLAARSIRVVETDVAEVLSDGDGRLSGVRLVDGEVVARSVLAVATRLQTRDAGIAGLGLPTEEVEGIGRRFVTGPAGTTAVPGVWVAGNATDLTAQVGASAAAGALAGAHINAQLVSADTDAALAAVPA